MKNLNKAALLSLVALTLIAAPSAWAADRMKSGQWEMTTTARGKAHTSTHCVAPQEVKDINGTPAELRAFIEKTTTAAHCTVQNFKTQGDTVSYTTACMGLSSDSTTSYHGDSYEMVITSKGASKSETRQVKARRLGACP
jgi:hypothetical protein